ncbi:MAG: hypothetical protein Q4A05_04715 [Ruminococcus sp.]|nr:hypothetical protein [Ruminococcus sp.]
MRRKINKTAVSIVLAYVVLTCGLRMFLLSYANSYNKLSEEPIAPARLTIGSDSARLDILGRSVHLRYLSDSRGSLAAYLLTPDELRAAAVLAALVSDRKVS